MLIPHVHEKNFLFIFLSILVKSCMYKHYYQLFLPDSCQFLTWPNQWGSEAKPAKPNLSYYLAL